MASARARWACCACPRPASEAAARRGRGLRSHVSTAHVLGRVAEHVVRVDERDDEAEGLRQVGTPEPALGLPRVELVPSLPQGAGVARPKCSAFAFSPASGGSQSATRSRVAADPRRMAPIRPAASRYPPGGSGATCPCRPPHTRPRGASGRGSECSAAARAHRPTSARVAAGPGRTRHRPLTRRPG